MVFLSKIIGFVLALGILIVIHEYGHYWVARRCGVKVLRFSIGFGRPLWRKVVGADRTEWVVAAVPLGGYVRMLDERDGEHGSEPIPPEDLARAFNRQSLAKRVAIVCAGPVANLLLAVVLYWGLNVVGTMEPPARVGEPIAHTPAERAGLQAGDLVLAIDGEEVRSWNEMSWLLLQRAVERSSPEVVVQGSGGAARSVTLDLHDLAIGDLESNPLPRIGLRPQPGQPEIGRLADNGAARTAGLEQGDVVLRIGPRPMRSARDLIDVVRGSPGRPLEFLVERDGQTQSVTVTPATVVEKDGARIGRIGAAVGEKPQLVEVRYGPVESVGLALRKLWETTQFSLRMLWKMVTLQASVKNLSGPLTIADYAGQTLLLGPVEFIKLLALISISLGILNLMPIPLLDGGHLLYYLIETIRGRPPTEAFVQWGQRVGAVVLLLLTVLATTNDIGRIFRLF